MSTRTLAHRLIRQITRTESITYDDFKRRVREAEILIVALYADAGACEPDTAILAAQMLDDEGETYAAALVRDLFPPGDEPSLAVPQARTLASLQTGRLAVVVNLHPRDRSSR